MFFLQLLRGFLCSFYSTPVWVHKQVLFLRGFLCSFYSSCVDCYVLFTAHLCEYTNNSAFPAWFFMFFLQLLRGFLCSFYSTPVWVHKQRCFSCVVFYVLFTAPAWIFMLFLQHTCVSTQTTVLFLRGFFMFFLQHTCVSTQTTVLFLRNFSCSIYSTPVWVHKQRCFSCVIFHVLITAHLCKYTNNHAFPAWFFMFFLQLLRGFLCSFYSTPVWVHKQRCFSCVFFFVLFTAPAWMFMFFLQHTCVSTQTTVLFLRGFLCSFYSTPVWVHKQRCFSCVVFYVLFTAPAWIFMFFLQHTCVSTQTVLFLRGFLCSFYSIPVWVHKQLNFACIDFTFFPFSLVSK